jgi:hypothetical protein
MKKWIIAPLVGGIILFAWQFVSWTFSGLHASESTYTPAQDSIMACLNSNLPEGGMYLLPNYPPGTPFDKQQEVCKSYIGKPFATINYVKVYSMDMTLPMIRGFLIDFLIVFCLIYMLTRAGTPTKMRIFAASIAAGLLCFLFGPYTQHNWFSTPAETLYPYLLDIALGWGLTGLWLGWYLNKK